VLPHPVHRPVTGAEARALDRQAAARFGVSTRLLMENAGARCADVAWSLAVRTLRAGRSPAGRKNPPGQRTPRRAGPGGSVAPSFAIFCGPGGNGGDGFVVARHLALAGLRVRVEAFGTPRPGSDAADARAAWRALRVPPFRGTPTIVVDALVGTGLARPLAGPARRFARRIEALRRAGARVVAVDVPSGVCADTGATDPAAVVADLTVAIAAPKVGLLAPGARAHRGRVVVVPFGAPGEMRRARRA
jgi:NAD(P)H-hydrate epimerase